MPLLTIQERPKIPMDVEVFEKLWLFIAQGPKIEWKYFLVQHTLLEKVISSNIFDIVFYGI